MNDILNFTGIDTKLLVIIIAFGLINLCAFLSMMLDKMKSAKPGAERISEGRLFFWASCFGSIGIYLGMFVFRHKTRKWYFLIGIPILILENAAILYFIYSNIQ